MYVIVDNRQLVTTVYSSGFEKAGISALGLDPGSFSDWIRSASDSDIFAVDAFFIGNGDQRARWPRQIRVQGSTAPIIALIEAPSLEETLELFAAGVDDVVRKPVHVAELQARVGAIHRRSVAATRQEGTDIGVLKVFFDGRDPEVHGEAMPLPRRERRILEYLARNVGRRVSKTQIFNNVYGVLSEDVDEDVIESHISKLRKKLKQAAGVDLIDSRRYLGYTLTTDA
ncbi:response regulator transcription factor [Chthonobacter rhizosphaerae]|uniref:response regulator transcription factor n=1 Tax=Chthonobacter rhizosphaerae TaxID=2735553 RepID=UPI0015EFC33F|nr:response regulator transcription factor [Chthonobacter rhizosphaerae]